MTFSMLLVGCALAAAPASPEGVFKGADGLLIVKKASTIYQFKLVGAHGGGNELTLHPAPSDAHIMTVDGELWAEFTPDYSSVTMTATTPGNQDAPIVLTRVSVEEAASVLAKAALAEAQDEGRRLVKMAATSERAFYAEKDAYSADPMDIGFLPEPCPDKSRAPARKGEVAACRFVVTIKVTGKGPDAQVLLTATGVVAPVKGMVWTSASYERPGQLPWEPKSGQ